MPARWIAIISGAYLALSAPAGRAAEEVTVLAAGDIQWAAKPRNVGVALYPPRPFYDELLDKIFDHLPIGSEYRYRQVPYVYEHHAHPWPKLGGRIELDQAHTDKAIYKTIHHDMHFDTVEDAVKHPFSKIAPVLREADIAFVNLENPLSDRGRHTGLFRGSPAFAGAIASAGVDVVSTANNHALDLGEEGLTDTIKSLAAAGLPSVGTGTDLARATAPAFLERNGLRFAFLAYSMVENSGELGFASSERSGVAPLDPILVEEGVKKVRDQADYVIVSFHWSRETLRDIHPVARAIAHRTIDAGADVIIGHHPHVPQGVEVYHGGIVLYSLGNFIFGFYRDDWMDNILARITFTPEAIVRVEILPIAGIGRDLGQPYLLEGQPANSLLTDLQVRSAALDTLMVIEDGVGVIKPDVARLPPARFSASALLHPAARLVTAVGVLALVFVVLMWTIAPQLRAQSSGGSVVGRERPGRRSVGRTRRDD